MLAKEVGRPQDAFGAFLVLWTGQLLSTIGSGATAFALGVQAFKQTGSAASFALTVLCAFLPTFLLTPLGGVLADRHDRRMLIILSDVGSIVGIALVLLALEEAQVQPWQIYVGIAFNSVFGALRSPAYKASVSDYLAPSRYGQASGLVQLANATQFLISPMLAGLLLSVTTIQVLLFLDIASFAIAIACTQIVRRRAAPTAGQADVATATGVWQDLCVGFAATVSNRGVVVVVSLVSLLLFYVGLLQTLFAPMVLSFTDERTLGVAQSACASGMLFSGLLIGVTSKWQRHGRVLAAFLVVTGLSFAAMGLSQNIWGVSVPAFLFFSTVPFVNASIDVLIRQNLDPANEGKVWAFVSLMTYLGSVIAYAIGGYLADLVFNPLFMPGGAWSQTLLARLVGVGPGRGIGFMFLVSGLGVVAVAVACARSRRIEALERPAAPRQELST